MAYTVEFQNDKTISYQEIEGDTYQESPDGYLIEFYKGDQLMFAVAKHLVRSIKVTPEEGEKD